MHIHYILEKNLKKNERASVLIGMVTCLLIMLLCIHVGAISYLNKSSMLILEKRHRIGKIMIHMVWQTIRHQPEKYHQQIIAFNTGKVSIEKQGNILILTSQLDTQETIRQKFILSEE